MTIKHIEKITAIQGWMDERSCCVFDWLHNTQYALGLDNYNDILEIGVHKGKSACALGQLLVDDEAFYACDVFKHISPEEFVDNWTKIVNNPNLNILHKSSRDLLFPPSQKFRIVHIDGDHAYYNAYNDIILAYNHLSTNGVIIVDDFLHPCYLGVNQAVHDFLRKYDVGIFLVAYQKAYISHSRTHEFFLKSAKTTWQDINNTHSHQYYWQIHNKYYHVIV